MIEGNEVSRVEKGFWSLAALGLMTAASPFVVETATDESRNWFPILFVAGVLSAIVFGSIAIAMHIHHRRRADLLSGRDLLACWTYGEDDWRRFVDEENTRLDESTRAPLYIVFALLIAGTAVGFMLGRGTGIIVAAVLGSILVLGAGLMIAAPAIRRRALSSRTGRPPEVRIGLGGLSRCREFHRWSGFEAALDHVEIAPGSPPHLAFTYSYPSGNSRMTTTVRVPVPADREAEAESVASRLRPEHAPKPRGN